MYYRRNDMKKHLLIMFLMIGCASDQLITSDKKQIQNIYNLKMSKSQIYDKSLEWIIKTFVSPKSVIQLKDKISGKIIAKGVAKWSGVYPTYVLYIMTIEAKDNKLRVTYDSIIFETNVNREITKRALTYQSEYDFISNYCSQQDRDLVEYLNSANKSSNW